MKADPDDTATELDDIKAGLAAHRVLLLALAAKFFEENPKSGLLILQGMEMSFDGISDDRVCRAVRNLHKDLCDTINLVAPD